MYQCLHIFTSILEVGPLEDVVCQEGLVQRHKVDIYKVCLKHSGTLISSLGYELPGCIIYRIGEPVVPISGYGPLCGFSNFTGARDYAKSLRVPGICIYTATGILSKENTVWCPSHIRVRSSVHSPIDQFPADTVLCDSITLIKQIYIYKVGIQRW